MQVVIEGSAPEAASLERLLSAEGHDVCVLRPAELDAAVPPADVAFMDVWTPEVAPRVGRLRAQGTVVSCLGDLLLERWRGPTIAITGTAGKTSTAALVASILRAAGVDLAVSAGARAGNLWPTDDLLGRLGRSDASATLLLELTSSHLAFVHRSPHVAAVTSLWPDHLELHGSLERYRAAKETILRHQRPGDVAVLDADTAAAQFAAATPAVVAEASVRRPVARGAWLGERGIVLAPEGTVLGHLEQRVPHPANAVVAAALAAAVGVPAEAIVEGITSAPAPRWRAEPIGTLTGIPVVDDGMAATPAKAAATLAQYPSKSVVLLAGGMSEIAGVRVHDAAEERALLERACDEIARAARLVVVFGPAAPRLTRPLGRRGVDVVVADDVAEAVALAVAHTAGARALILSPLFPLSLDDRSRFGSLVRASGAYDAGGVGGRDQRGDGS